MCMLSVQPMIAEGAPARLKSLLSFKLCSIQSYILVHFSAIDGKGTLGVHAEREEVHGDLVSMIMQRPDAFPVDAVVMPACIEVLDYKHGIKTPGKICCGYKCILQYSWSCLMTYQNLCHSHKPQSTTQLLDRVITHISGAVT